MVSKQDGVAARTPADLERKYSFGKTFAEVMGYATDAQTAAEIATEAANRANSAVDGLDQEEIFRRLTNDGQAQGIYRDPDTGEIYINASYLATGVIASADGTANIDLTIGIARFFNGLIANGLWVRSKATDDIDLFRVATAPNSTNGNPYFYAVARSATGEALFYLSETFDSTTGEPNGVNLRLSSPDGVFDAEMTATNTGAQVNLRKGTSGRAVASIDENGEVMLSADKINGKVISWKANTDGTYTLIGQ